MMTLVSLLVLRVGVVGVDVEAARVAAGVVEDVEVGQHAGPGEVGAGVQHLDGLQIPSLCNEHGHHRTY